MENNSKLKLFISYSHLDENEVKEFIKFLSPLKNDNLFEEWYDRKIIAGDDFEEKIDNNLENADVICLFISASFLASKACNKEKKRALELRATKNVRIVPIILSFCGWLDDKQINPKLTLPNDGKPISSYADKSEGWLDVYNGIKSVLNTENKLRNINVKEDFVLFLQDADLLTKAHSQKEKVLLEDIFIYPNLFKYDDLKDTDKKMSSAQLIDEFTNFPKIMIAGEDQSGKTFFCKKIFTELLSKKYLPVYLSLKYSEYQENAEKRLLKSFREQYDASFDDDYNLRNIIIPILDDFHLLRNREKFLSELSNYSHMVVIVDSIYTLNFKNENIIQSFKLFKILELSPLLRYELIKKWVNLTDKVNGQERTPNSFYKSVDEKTEFIDQALGKVLSSGIMPAYPFVILSLISYYEIFEKPLDQEITSQGYCYQAFIYLFLRKQGVKSDDIETYVNFLTEISFYFLDQQKQFMPSDEFSSFLDSYLGKFNLPVEQDILLKNLSKAKLFGLDNLGNYYFHHSYIYYYFIAKYLAEHFDSCKNKIEQLVQNLQKNENAYIVIFIAHHSKNNEILEEIILNSLLLFDKYQPATLIKDELSFFDAQIEDLIKEILPGITENAEKVRRRKLEVQETVENNKHLEEEQSETENELKEENLIARDLRRSIKTVEVMGRILKNRAGSLEKDKLNFIFREAMFVHLRILSSFFELIKDEKEQAAIIKFISKRISIITEKIIEEKGRVPSPESLEKLSRIIFWNTNFLIVYSFITKLIHSLGSDKLLNVVNEVCESVGTPASFLVKHGILMWYNKNLQIEQISEEIGKSNYSEISKKIMKRLIVRHASMHVIDYKDRQRIETKLKIPSDRLLIEKIKSGNSN